MVNRIEEGGKFRWGLNLPLYPRASYWFVVRVWPLFTVCIGPAARVYAEGKATTTWYGVEITIWNHLPRKNWP